MNWEWLARYLTIPADYCRHLGGLRWSANGDAVEYASGPTFVMKGEIDLFNEGFTATRSLVHFGFILHLMHIVGLRDISQGATLARYRAAFSQTGRNWRNAGAFLASLCKEIPPVAYIGPWNPSAAGQCLAAVGVSVGQGEVPPLAPMEFEGRIITALAETPLRDVYIWLRYGRGPVSGADEIVRQLEETKPRTLGHVMASLAQRKRLSGAVPFVSQLVSALALPPRRLADQELPLGGYVDVATRGQPEHILPSQFAVDDLEFVRRFAQRELLYFRREEPHSQLKEELLILLDQGVRTWGDVRLVLSAAVFALAKRAESRRTPFRVAVTSTHGRIIDPLQVEDEELGSMLEASDLTLLPSFALDRVLAEPAEAARDVVLLTHPRNLAEAELARAARQTSGDTRLFALSVDEEGQARLDELRQGVPLAVRQFRIDRSPAPPPRTELEPLTDPLPAFTGDVEPVGFPFRIGVSGPILHLAFDYSGDWLLIGGPKGMLHVAHLSSGEVETWPRGYDGQSLLTQVDAVLGVAGGFVVGGRFGAKLVAMHYDLSSRTARLHRLPLSDNESWKWHYFLEQHSIVIRAGDVCEGIDLATGAHGNQRVKEACDRSKGRWPAPWLNVPSRSSVDSQPSLQLDSSGTLVLRGMMQVWKPFTPMTDGKPTLAGRVVFKAQCNGTILALASFTFQVEDKKVVLHLYRGQRGQGLGEIALRRDDRPGQPAQPGALRPPNDFMLSPTGQRLAVQTGTSRVTVYDLASGLQPIWQSPLARCHSGMEVELGDRWLTVQVGKFVHFFRWDGGRLLHRQTRGNKEALVKEEIAGTPLYGTAAKMRPAAAVYREPSIEATYTTYSWQRFSDMTSPKVGVDHYSQVAVLDDQRRPVCLFYIFRERWAAWLPDGTRLGPSTITGGPETPNAVNRIGKALLGMNNKASRER